jgi:DNA-binding PadR family transcriptional regulator
MSVRHSLLAILAEHPAHGYGLKSGFEKRTAGAWPLNVGQVYTTLARLERDGLVATRGRGPAAGEWNITERGRRELAEWFDAPVDDRIGRDGLAIKVLLALAAAQVDVNHVLQRQREATMERLQRYTRHKRRVDPNRDLASALVLDALVVRAEAEIRWLDLCEERLRQRAGAPS